MSRGVLTLCGLDRACRGFPIGLQYVPKWEVWEVPKMLETSSNLSGPESKARCKMSEVWMLAGSVQHRECFVKNLSFIFSGTTASYVPYSLLARFLPLSSTLARRNPPIHSMWPLI